LRARTARGRRPPALCEARKVPPLRPARPPRLHRRQTGELPPRAAIALTRPALPGLGSVRPEGKASRRKEAGLARRRFQTGCLQKIGKRRKLWVVRWREDVMDDTGKIVRVR